MYNLWKFNETISYFKNSVILLSAVALDSGDDEKLSVILQITGGK